MLGHRTLPGLLVCCLLLLLGTVWAVSRSNHNTRIDPVLKDKLVGMDPSSTLLVWVMFKDKGENPRSISRVLDVSQRYLSARALERRRRALKTDRVSVYEDLPVNAHYIGRIEDMGGRLRAESRWLNGASFIMPAGQVEKASRLEHVKNIREVAIFKERELRKPVSRKTLRGKRKGDVLLYDYGPSEEQLRLIKVIDAHQIGLTGEGANIGILDTGFRTSIKAVEHVRVAAEHDFLGGDQIPLYRSISLGAWDSLSTIQQRVKLLENMVMAIGTDSVIHAFWEADTIRSQTSARDVYHSYSSYPGSAWLVSPTNVSMSAALSRRPSVVASDTVYLFWEDGTDSLNADADQEIFMVKWYNGSLFGLTNISDDLTWSTWPSAFLGPGSPDMIHLVWMDTDSTIIYANSSPPGWSDTHDVSGGVYTGRVSPASIVVDDSGYVHIVWSTEPQGQLIYATSPDNGLNFSYDTVWSGASDDPVLAVSDSILYLFFSEIVDASAGRVMYMRSTDHGASWSGASPISGGLSPFLGRVSSSSSGSRVVCAWEDDRVIYVRRSTDYGQSWTAADSFNLPFSYDPVVCCFGSDDYLTFKRRGDDNTDYELSQDGDRQHWHGTEMLSIMAGFKLTQLVGPAFKANYFFAKTEKYINIVGYPHYYEMPCEEDFWIEGLEWLESQGVDIVSSSLGYPDLYEYYRRDGKTALVTQAAYKAYKLGVLVFNAIGNAREDDTLNAGSLYPPSDADSIVSVGGVLSGGRWLSPYEGLGFYSAKGPSADGRTKPEVVAPVEAYMVNPAYQDSFWYGIGTSGATALTAGVAGLLLEAHPSWRGDPARIRDCLMQTASMASAPNDTMGWGIVNAIGAIHCDTLEVDTFSTDCLARFYPNPVRGDRGQVTIAFHLINQAIPRIRIYSMSGELVKRWEEEDLEEELQLPMPVLPGRYSIDWDLKNDAGKDVASGIYVVILKGFQDTCLDKLAVVR
ncbi:MAG: S8 family serine peptidase [bacterium]